MNSRLIARICIFINIAIYLCMIYGMTNWYLSIYQNQFWHSEAMMVSKILLIIISLIFIIYTLIVLIGLAKFMDWGRKLSISWNLCIAFLLIVIPPFVYFLLAGRSSSLNEMISITLDFNYIVQLVFGFLLIVITIFYNKKLIKSEFRGKIR